MMSEPETNIEIEDVLSSIRRLVSRDAGAGSHTHLPHRAAAVPAVEADCLVLTPALRIAEAAPLPPATAEADAPLPPAEGPEDTAALEAAEAAPEPVAEDGAEPSPADPAPAEDIPAPEPMLDPRPMTEAETLLAQAEAALAETGSVLDTATTALGTEASEGATAGDAPLAAPGPADLGDELTRLETTIAELEAAVADSGVDFEPEEGHPFSAEGPAPLPDLSEVFGADAADDTADDAADGAAANDVADDEAAEVARALAQIDAAEVVDQDLTEAETAPVAEAGPAPDSRQDTWTDEGNGVGMDWAEATLNLARRTPSRRLEMADAEESRQQVAGLRSSYDDLRAELSQDQALVDSMFDVDPPEEIDDSVIDEAMLRDMVAQMVRDELRGALGERITQNVRKLVRREIQRALMGQDYE